MLMLQFMLNINGNNIVYHHVWFVP